MAANAYGYLYVTPISRYLDVLLGFPTRSSYTPDGRLAFEAESIGSLYNDGEVVTVFLVASGTSQNAASSCNVLERNAVARPRQHVTLARAQWLAPLRARASDYEQASTVGLLHMGDRPAPAPQLVPQAFGRGVGLATGLMREAARPSRTKRSTSSALSRSVLCSTLMATRRSRST